MFAWLKKPTTLLFTLGFVLTSGYFAIGLYQNNQLPNLDLISQLPKPNSTLPPPSTYLMQTEPDPSIPGIRRLKIMRPSFMQSDDKVSQKDLYLTGTKSAELIRKAVHSSVKPFPEVSLQEAALGALAADDWGFQTVQSYINQALGDENRTKVLIQELLAAIESRSDQYDNQQISEAINLVIEAGARTYWSAFMAPVILDKSFKLKENAIGWDFGPNNKNPFDNFTRVTPNSDLVRGKQLRSQERSRQGASILNDGIKNMEQFVATGLKDGLYRVVILTGKLPGNEEIEYPFGVQMKQNGAQLNLVDTRATEKLVPVMRLATEGPGRVSDLEEASSDVEEQSSASGHMIVTRAEVSDGTLRLNFRAIGAASTYVTAVIIYPEEAPEFIEDLTTEVQQILDRLIETASGEEGNDTNLVPTPNEIMGIPIYVISPSTAFADNANGTPTETSNGATQTEADPVTETGGNTNTGDSGATNEDTTNNGGTTDLGSQTDTSGSSTTLTAEAGAYAPIALGEDFTLDGCGSTLSGVSVCSLTDSGTIELVWLMDGEEIGTGDTLVVQTGDGTAFPTDGSNTVTLEVRYTGTTGGQTVTLEDGSTIFLPGDLTLVSVDTAVIQIIAPIPEPETVALMLSGMIMIGWMHHRRRRRLIPVPIGANST